MLLTIQQLKKIMPNSKATSWINYLNPAMTKFEIDTPKRIAAFLAQSAHESSELRVLVENLKYSDDDLMRIWPKRFPTTDFAKKYDKDPEKIANYIYANRLGNGPTSSGDGWNFRGRGIFQTTGKYNYLKVGKALNLPLDTNPEYLEEPGYAALSAGFYWENNRLNEFADKNNEENFIKLTIKINGGKIGLDSRLTYWKKAKNILGIK